MEIELKAGISHYTYRESFIVRLVTLTVARSVFERGRHQSFDLDVVHNSRFQRRICQTPLLKSSSLHLPILINGAVFFKLNFMHGIIAPISSSCTTWPGRASCQLKEMRLVLAIDESFKRQC